MRLRDTGVSVNLRHIPLVARTAIMLFGIAIEIVDPESTQGLTLAVAGGSCRVVEKTQ